MAKANGFRIIKQLVNPPTRHLTTCLIGVLSAIAVLPLSAARAPQSPEELRAAADLIVVAEVTSIESRSERSRVERGFGNYDWGVYCTLQIELVEKGKVSSIEAPIVARCFVTQRRKSMIEYIGLQSHSPIPAVGERVRAHLSQDPDGYQVLHPNGFTSVDGKTLASSVFVDGLKRGRYTYFLPLEMWVYSPLFSVLALCLGVNAYRGYERWWAWRDTGAPLRIRYSFSGLLSTTFCLAIGLVTASSQVIAVSLVVITLVALVWFTARPPRSVLARRLWCGINVAFCTAMAIAIVSS